MQHDDIRHRFRWQFKTGPGVDNSVPDSWLSAIFSLCANVDVLIQGELCEGFHWLDIKEKHGMLSVSYTAPAALTDAIDALVEAAGTACRQTVPAAAPATVHFAPAAWLAKTWESLLCRGRTDFDGFRPSLNAQSPRFCGLLTLCVCYIIPEIL